MYKAGGCRPPPKDGSPLFSVSFWECVENFFRVRPLDFVGFAVDSQAFSMVHFIHQANIGKGVDGEKYHGRSVSVSGGQCEPRNKESVGRTLRSCNLNAGIRQ